MPLMTIPVPALRDAELVTPCPPVVAKLAKLLVVIKPLTGVETPPTVVLVHGAVVQPNVLSRVIEPGIVIAPLVVMVAPADLIT